MQRPVPVERLTEALLRKFPVWEFVNDDEVDETLVRPVAKLPTPSADGRLIGCEFRLADGTIAFGFLGNLSLTKPQENPHFLTVSVYAGREICHLARYHDVDRARSGPAWLASKLGKKETDVFPFSYDVSAFVRGRPDCVRGSVPSEPSVKLSRTELIQLAVRG